MAEVILDNIYKSFPTRRQTASEEKNSSETPRINPQPSSHFKADTSGYL
ncbi:MAG: hypothetical protein RSE13_01300 [Planktothrix sp. GU0601_MAG3]|nr:MAG: hypothetical protein RSE13_01300 [Planktothrix sp. GU0601_MAG3]